MPHAPRTLVSSAQMPYGPKAEESAAQSVASTSDSTQFQTVPAIPAASQPHTGRHTPAALSAATFSDHTLHTASALCQSLPAATIMSAHLMPHMSAVRPVMFETNPSSIRS